MIRLLGFLTGSALMTGIILAAIGVPELREAPARIAAAPATATTRVAAPPAVEPEIQTLAVGAETTAAPVSKDTAEPASPAPEPGSTPPPPEPHWHSFWNPFRSEIAASGFAKRLRGVTGIDYRVVRLAPGSYQVAFAYRDDGERRTKIAQIEAATGLRLPEEVP